MLRQLTQGTVRRIVVRAPTHELWGSFACSFWLGGCLSRQAHCLVGRLIEAVYNRLSRLESPGTARRCSRLNSCADSYATAGQQQYGKDGQAYQNTLGEACRGTLPEEVL